MKMWGPIIGAGIAAGGSLLSQALAGKQDNYHPEVWRNDAYKNTIKGVQAIKDAANKHGFHPLALLGSNQNYNMVQPSYSGGGGSVGLGDAVGAGLSTFNELYQSDQDRLEREEDRAYNESMQRRREALDNLRRKEVTPEMKLQRENMQLQNELLRQDILNAATSRTKIANMRAEGVGGINGSVITPFQNKVNLPLSTDAATMQNEFGEMVGDTYGWLRWLESQLTNPKTGEGHAHRWMREHGLFDRAPSATILRRRGSQ